MRLRVVVPLLLIGLLAPARSLVRAGRDLRDATDVKPGPTWSSAFALGADQNSQPKPIARLPRVAVHPGGHYLQTEDGRPFFWLGDTAWELIHRGTREEVSYYLKTRAAQGYTVIQTVVLAEFDGVNTPTALGDVPFVGGDPSRPNEKYFDRVVEIVDEAAARRLYVGLLPAWGDKLTAPWGVGPRLFRNDNSYVTRTNSQSDVPLISVAGEQLGNVPPSIST